MILSKTQIYNNNLISTFSVFPGGYFRLRNKQITLMVPSGDVAAEGAGGKTDSRGTSQIG